MNFIKTKIQTLLDEKHRQTIPKTKMRANSHGNTGRQKIRVGWQLECWGVAVLQFIATGLTRDDCIVRTLLEVVSGGRASKEPKGGTGITVGS